MGSYAMSSEMGELSSGAFVALPFDVGEIEGPVGLTMRTDTALSAAFSLLLQAIREAARSQGPAARAAKPVSGRRSFGEEANRIEPGWPAFSASIPLFESRNVEFSKLFHDGAPAAWCG